MKLAESWEGRAPATGGMRWWCGMSEPNALSRQFDESAQFYDEVRPHYFEEMVEHIVTFACLKQRSQRPSNSPDLPACRALGWRHPAATRYRLRQGRRYSSISRPSSVPYARLLSPSQPRKIGRRCGRANRLYLIRDGARRRTHRRGIFGSSCRLCAQPGYLGGHRRLYGPESLSHRRRLPL